MVTLIVSLLSTHLFFGVTHRSTQCFKVYQVLVFTLHFILSVGLFFNNEVRASAAACGRLEEKAPQPASFFQSAPPFLCFRSERFKLKTSELFRKALVSSLSLFSGNQSYIRWGGTCHPGSQQNGEATSSSSRG